MGFIKALVGFGIGIIGFGFYWTFQNDIIDRYIAEYIIQNDYYVLSNLFWDGLPVVCILTGVVALVMAGIMRKGNRVVYYE